MFEAVGIIVAYTVLVGWMVIRNGNTEIPPDIRMDMYRVLI